MELSQEEIKILAHTLGYNKDPKEKRNYFNASEKDKRLLNLVEKGAMTSKKISWLGEDQAYFFATDKGKTFIEDLQKNGINLVD